MLALATASFGDGLRLTEADNGRTNQVNVGGAIEIILPGNPTAGYSWELDSFGTNVLQPAGVGEYLRSAQPGSIPRVGAGGRFVFRFKTVGTGRGDIKMIYRRSWETTAADRAYSVVIEVK